MYFNSEECIRIAEYMVTTRATVRSAAKYFGIPKTNIHYCVTTILKDVNSDLYNSVRKLLDANRNDRARRGGLAVHMKHRKLSEER